MTEPVAYMYEDHVFNTEKEAVLFKKEFDRYKHDGMLKHVILPLFTADEISDIYRQNNRVEMTQAEFDEFHDLFENDFDLYSAITEISDTNLRTTLYDRLFTGTQKDKDRQNEFAVLWASYNPLEPEETIEIVPNMKWFVRSKKRDDEGDYAFLSGSDLDDLDYFRFDYARAFDTKEEAELWNNPLTEAVQLPVEEE